MSNFHHPYLSVIQQPPDVWYNQQGGKKECFCASIELVGELNVSPLLRIPVEVSLLYEGGERVHNQSILQLIIIPELGCEERSTIIQARINDVSKNHQHRRFCLQFEIPEKFMEQHKLSISGCISSTITVLSKKSVIRKRNLSQDLWDVSKKNKNFAQIPTNPMTSKLFSIGEPNQKKIKMSLESTESTEQLKNWSLNAYNLLRLVSAQQAIVTDQTGRKILRVWCPVCGANFTESNTAHMPNCALQLQLQEFELNLGFQPNYHLSANNLQATQQLGTYPLASFNSQFLQPVSLPQISPQTSLFSFDPSQLTTQPSIYLSQSVNQEQHNSHAYAPNPQSLFLSQQFPLQQSQQVYPTTMIPNTKKPMNRILTFQP